MTRRRGGLKFGEHRWWWWMTVCAALLVVFACSRPARAEPPPWWADYTSAGPPNYVPSRSVKPPVDGSVIPSPRHPAKLVRWFEQQIVRNGAEALFLRERIEELKGELRHVPTNLIVGEGLKRILAKLAEHAVCPEAELAVDAYEAYEAYERAKETLGGLDLTDAERRIHEDAEYVAWLDYWYAQYRPGYKNVFDSSRAWVRNPNSPFNRFVRRLRSEARNPRKARTARDAVWAHAAGCPSKPKPKPKPKPCTGVGGIDVLLKGEFFGNEWAAGTITATSNSGARPQSASVGFDSESEGHFGPWPCGSTTTLTATPQRGYHFDRWSSDQSICRSASDPVCVVPIAAGKADSVTAEFAPTVYTLTVTNSGPFGFIQGGSGNGYTNPNIDCGSQPNGPVVETGTVCTVGAQAQRSDTDITELRIASDRPGPGGQDYAITGVTGCDSIEVLQSDAGGEALIEQCLLKINSDRHVTASYAVAEGEG